MNAEPERAGAVSSREIDQAGRLPPGIWKVIGVASIGSFMSQLDATVVNVSLAGLAAELHAGLAAIQWVMSGYLLALALMLPLNGWLVERIGARAVYLWCFFAFTISSALCGLAWSACSLIAFRVLQGMSGGLLAPMAQMMVARTAGKHLPQVAGIVTMPVLLAPLLGPVIAGAILQHASWRWLFLINLPVGILAFGLAALCLPDDRDATPPRGLDLLGLALLSPGLVLFLYGSDHLGARNGAIALAVSILVFAMYYRIARTRGDAALIDLRLFKSRAFFASLAAMFMMNGIVFAGQMLIPIYLIEGCGVSPSRTGWLLAPLGLGMMFTYPFMGRLTRRFGIRKLTAAGALVALVGTLALVFLAYDGLSIVVLAASLFLRGIGISAVGVPAMSSGYATVAKRDLPMATTAMNIVQRLGGPTMTTLCASFLAWRLAATHSSAAFGAASISDAFVATFGLLCLLHALLFLATLRLPWLLPEAA